MKRTPDKDAGIDTLVQRLDMILATNNGHIIAFVAARHGEGVSTVARDYATALADSSDHKILLIDAGPIDRDFIDASNLSATPALADTAAAGHPVEEAIAPLSPHLFVTRWAGPKRNRATTKVFGDEAFWAKLRDTFATIIIDAPSLKNSAEGIAFAERADATVLVVEAEKTRQPVIENLRDTLTAAGAKIVGIVMNKRRYYIPAKVYQNM